MLRTNQHLQIADPVILPAINAASPAVVPGVQMGTLREEVELHTSVLLC